jgi:hypothetical protein
VKHSVSQNLKKVMQWEFGIHIWQSTERLHFYTECTGVPFYLYGSSTHFIVFNSWRI